jgi:hypothetical protein
MKLHSLVIPHGISVVFSHKTQGIPDSCRKRFGLRLHLIAGLLNYELAHAS